MSGTVWPSKPDIRRIRPPVCRECRETAERVSKVEEALGELSARVKEMSDEVGRSSSVNENASISATEAWNEIKEVKRILSENSEADQVYHDIYRGSKTMATFIIKCAQVVGALTIIAGGVVSFWYMISHMKPPTS